MHDQQQHTSAQEVLDPCGLESSQTGTDRNAVHDVRVLQPGIAPNGISL